MPVENNFQHDELSRRNPGERLRVADLVARDTGKLEDWSIEVTRA